MDQRLNRFSLKPAFGIFSDFTAILPARMANPQLTFGEMTTYGELARGVHPADEMGLAMALALGQPDDPAPAFATVPVLLNGCPIGQMRRVQYVWGGVHYEFESGSGQTRISSETGEAVLQRLTEVLGLTSQPKGHHDTKHP